MVLKDTGLPRFDGVYFSINTAVNSLGIRMDPTLLLEKQVNAAGGKNVFFHLSLVRKMEPQQGKIL